jgi:Flp pilus assembly protein TadG
MSRSGISKRCLLDRRGGTVVEMALVANAFLLLLLGGVEIGRYFFLAEQVRYAVGEVARAAIIDPDTPWTDQKAADFAAKMGVLNSTKLKMEVNIARQTAPSLSTVTVRAQYPYQFALSYLSNLAAPVDSRVTLSFVATSPP